jgi:hypothetical protein
VEPGAAHRFASWSRDATESNSLQHRKKVSTIYAVQNGTEWIINRGFLSPGVPRMVGSGRLGRPERSPRGLNIRPHCS